MLGCDPSMTRHMDENPHFPRPPLRPTNDDMPAGKAAPRPRTRSARPARKKPRSAPTPPTTGPGGRRGGRVARVTLVVALAAVCMLAIASFVAYAQVAASLPDPTHQLKGGDQTSKVFDRRGKLIADLFADQNRTNVPLTGMPAALRQAVVATEDQRFYVHSGVDPIGILRALWTDVTSGQTAQGGSTITQQYVKNAFVTDERTLRRKVAEALLAYRVEKTYSKDQILEMYLNTIYFGHGAYGIQTAAQTYFGKSATQLDVAECAMLAGLIMSPGRYSPYIDRTAATARRRVVLGQMHDQGYLSEATYSSAEAESFKLAGLKPSASRAPYFIEYVKNALVTKFGADAVYRGGLRVETTLDLDMQQGAEEAVRSVLDRPSDPSAALVALDPATGEIRAMVGGRDFDSQQFNVAVQGRRQPGSAFKPFVLAAALGDGVSPEQTYECGPVELSTGGGPSWKVTGAGGDRSGPMRLREATELSVNSVFAQLIMQIGADKVAQAATTLGITTPVSAVPAIALGGLEQGVSPLDMASAYGTFANGGTRVSPRGVLRVKDAHGKVLLQEPRHAEKTISPAVAYLVTDMLRGVIARGTGKAAGIGRPAAGKTGTTQAYRDAWFVGYAPQLAASVWVGYPDSQQEMSSVHGRKVTGGSFPAEIWRRFMEAALKGTSAVDFAEPSGLATATICLDTGLLATDGCPRKGSALFLDGGLPKVCTLHAAASTVAVPAVQGLTLDAAEASLAKAGLAAAVTQRQSSAAATGHVVSQDPAPGTTVKRKSIVDLAVSLGAGAAPGRPPATAPATSPEPQVSFSYGPLKPKVHDTVSFEAIVEAGQPTTFTWKFGDGATARGKTASHVYASHGSYTVTLKVSDAKGHTAQVVRMLVVK